MAAEKFVPPTPASAAVERKHRVHRWTENSVALMRLQLRPPKRAIANRARNTQERADGYRN
jgi:hypothetical protein